MDKPMWTYLKNTYNLTDVRNINAIHFKSGKMKVFGKDSINDLAIVNIAAVGEDMLVIREGLSAEEFSFNVSGAPERGLMVCSIDEIESINIAQSKSNVTFHTGTVPIGTYFDTNQTEYTIQVPHP